MSEKRSIRHAYGEVLVELGKENNDIVVFDADLAHSTQTVLFQTEFKNRHFNMGIAEANMCLFAAGFARLGKIPFTSSFAMFLTGRAWEFIRNAIAYNNLNVKLVATHSGISVGEDGGSHQANEDIALMRMIPNMQVFVPCDYNETKQVIRYVSSTKGCAYVRLSRALAYDVFDNSHKFNPFIPVSISESSLKVKGVVFSTGVLTGHVKEALSKLKEEEIELDHYHIPSLKPLKQESILEIFRKKDYKYAISFEEHSIFGGLGDTLLSLLAEHKTIPFIKKGIPDVFGKSGNSDDLFEYFGLSVSQIQKTLKEINVK